MSLSIFGVRHHGPGCARSLRVALEELEPDILLVEGPPDGQSVLPLLTSKAMQPPVALLIYASDAPQYAVYYPFAQFSPEWQALRYALKRGILARFIDLPQAIQLAQAKEVAEKARQEQTAPHDEMPSSGKATMAGEVFHSVAAEIENVPAAEEEQEIEPLDLLAKAAGYSDFEYWWERQIEQRQDVRDLFQGILEAMSELRADPKPKGEHEARREAYMRQSIRAAQNDGFQRIAVVCGAWHSPVLSELDDATADAALLSGLKSIKVEATWIPWTNSCLSFRSGYGAGVTSPGWYEHLWHHPERMTIHWVAYAAQLLRSEGMDISSASVIEAVRLAEALAAIRDYPTPGLTDLHEAILTVLCHGNVDPMQLIREKLEIGEKMGEVAPETPAVPLQRDLESRQRKLRLKPSTTIETYDFDLRKDLDRMRSQLLHQLRLLNIEWGKPRRVSQRTSTFHELWKVQWQLEFVVMLIEANVWGNTLESAATSYTRHLADTTETLPELTELLDRVILAELPDALNYMLNCVQSKSAVSADVHHMMDALPPLARVARYGDVRQTRVERIMPVIDALFERIVIGLPGACTSLDDDAARGMVSSIGNAQGSISLLDRDDQRTEWQQVLRKLVERDSVHGLVRGRCCRLLLETRAIDDEELQRMARLALSPVNPPAQAATWLEGVLKGSGLLLLHQDGLWQALDRWLSDLEAETFVALLPLLRRAFSDFEPAEQRSMGEKVKHLRSSLSVRTPVAGGLVAHSTQYNQERANKVLPVLAHLLGVTYDGN